MKRTTFTFPGKLGDALHQWPAAFWWHRQSGKPFDVWLDTHTCKPLVPLIQGQPGVEEVTLQGGIESYNCGGQPWHFNLKAEQHADRHFIHLGLRSFPQRQLTLECLERSAVNVDVEMRDLAETPTFHVEPAPSANRIILHGTGICPHTKQTPGFWKFLAYIAPDLEHDFEEVVFVGSESDREIGTRVYPHWSAYDDQGDFRKLASYLAGSRAMIGCGSAPVVLAGSLCVPAIRVHDPIGQAPKVIWDNLGENQLNATEFELRAKWPEWRARWAWNDKGAAVEHAAKS